MPQYLRKINNLIIPVFPFSMVAFILDGAPKAVDIMPFRFERFAEGKLIEDENG